jgi:hypothetical protein
MSGRISAAEAADTAAVTGDPQVARTVFETLHAAHSVIPHGTAER